MKVGIVGGGQLAQMMIQAGISLGLDFSLLCSSTDESAPPFCADTTKVEHFNASNLAEFANRCDVITFDHELIPPEVIEQIPNHGSKFFPSASTLRSAANKFNSRIFLSKHGFAVPRFELASNSSQLHQAIQKIGYPCVIKTSHGGYDGRGVFMLNSAHDLSSFLAKSPRDTDLVVEPMLEISMEFAVLVVRNRAKDYVVYPIVKTLQQDSICVEVSVPSGLAPKIEKQAKAIAIRIADLVDSVGVLAIEMFVVNDQILINELAPRPHNSGHLTIEACVTSQFENHLRAITSLPLGSCELRTAGAAMVNVIGGTQPQHFDVATAKVLADQNIKIHLYGKTYRAGRKLGHVTALDTSPGLALERARYAADILLNVASS